MTSRRLALLIGLLAACSSTPATTSGGNGTPASLTISSGDGQTGTAGAALAVPVAALVRDNSGQAVAGVVVTFTVDSGGGSLRSLVATTGSNGIAIAGTWTLGRAPGAVNVVSATAGNLAPVKWHAQALSAIARPIFTNTVVSSGGGTLTYQKPGDPLDGLTVQIPPAAFPSGSMWTITADSNTLLPLPADFNQVGPTLIVSTGQGYADSNIVVTMPMPVDLADAVVPFYYDPVSGTIEPIPIVSRTSTTATFAARHFTADLLAVVGSAPSSGSLKASERTFGDVRIAWVRLPASKLTGTFDSGFRPGVDSWEFINKGEYVSPDGDCEGMSISEMYYYYFVTLGGGPSLYHHFDTSLANTWDNTQGIRFAGSVQGDNDAIVATTGSQISRLAALGEISGEPIGKLTAQWIVTTLKLTQRPVLVALLGTPGGHAVVAYSATSSGNQTDVQFADPNFPATARTMSFVDGTFGGVELSINADAPPGPFDQAYALAVTAEIPLRQLDSRWREFLNKTAGNDRYPGSYLMRVRDSLNHRWDTMSVKVPAATDTIRTTIPKVSMQFLCAGCTLPADGVTPADRQPLLVYDDSGVTKQSDAGTVVPTPGLQNPVVVALGSSPYAIVSKRPQYSFIDSRSVPVVYQPFSMPDHPTHGSVGIQYSFAATDGGLSTPQSTYTWNFDDGTTPVAVRHDSTVNHTFMKTGTFHVAVTLRGADSLIVGADTETVYVTMAWQFTTATQTGTIPPPSYATKSDTTELNAFNGLFADLLAHPANWVFFAADSAGCKAVILEQFSPPPVVTTTLVPSAERTIVAASSQCLADDPDTGTAAFGTIGSGTITGNLTPLDLVNSVGVLGGSINAQMTGNTLQGTFTWIISYSTGYATYSFDFSAQLAGGP